MVIIIITDLRSIAANSSSVAAAYTDQMDQDWFSFIASIDTAK